MLEQKNSRAHTSLHPDTHIGLLTLTVASLERSLAFYQQVIGFQLLEKREQKAILGVDTTPLLVLVEKQGATPKPERAVGLYHFAILVPSRTALAHALLKLAEAKYPLGGASDHAVSEALYLSDPDDNGIEIYRDRPRDEWPYRGKRVAMVTERLDIEGVLSEAKNIPQDWRGLVTGTTIGHMHLQVSDIKAAEAFYCQILGFDIVATMPSALFISAGGYHHHIGLNTWASLGGQRAPEGSAGLRSFTVTLPDSDELERVSTRLQAINQLFTRIANGIVVTDPWENRIVLTAGQIAKTNEVLTIAGE